MRKRLVLVLLCWHLMCLGCRSTDLPAEQLPADFSLQVCAKWEPTAATFLLEPDGTLRAATGAGCTLNTFPEPTMQLHREDVNLLYAIARRIDYRHGGSTKRLESDREQLQIVIHAAGQRHRIDLPLSQKKADYNTIHPIPGTPAADAIDLLSLLLNLTGINPFEQDSALRPPHQIDVCDP